MGDEERGKPKITNEHDSREYIYRERDRERERERDRQGVS